MIRINLHFTLSTRDIDFLLKTIEFIAHKGHLFLQNYHFNRATGEWTHSDFPEKEMSFSIEDDFSTDKVEMESIEKLRESYIQEAEERVRELSPLEESHFAEDSPEIERLKYFHYIHSH